MKVTGEARSLNTGSVRMFRPPDCTSTVAWPIQVAEASGGRAAWVPARRTGSVLVRSSFSCGSVTGVACRGAGGRPSVSAFQRQRSSQEKGLATWAPVTLRKPSGVWCGFVRS
jgi:hypothetical protein